MRLLTGMKRIGVVLVMGLAALNFAAYRQARAFTHFAPPGHRTPRANQDLVPRLHDRP